MFHRKDLLKKYIRSSLKKYIRSSLSSVCIGYAYTYQGNECMSWSYLPFLYTHWMNWPSIQQFVRKKKIEE